MIKLNQPQYVIEADTCLIGGGATDFHSYSIHVPTKLSTNEHFGLGGPRLFSRVPLTHNPQ